ncbi:MAG: glycogen debranching enzyme family protein [Bacteroidaceae bacterium]|nr:glycogen debranching enzyme family protein [Bacteroidaceae bacterium]
MSYLRFDKAQMTNLQESLPKEILRTNRSGAYSCSSIVDCNTRKYHGLLVVPVPELDDENHVLLSSLDETVIQHGAQFNLGLHKYSGNVFSPNGHKYIRSCEWDKLPTTIYRVGGVILKKEKVFQHFENRILIRYTLLDAHSVTTLRLRPFLAFRSVEECTHENAGANQKYDVIDNGIKTRLYAGYPELMMQLNKKSEFVFEPNWYRGIEYQKEQELGYDYKEDLYVPGYFEFNIKKGESVVFAAGLSELKTSQMKKIFDHEYEVHVPRTNFQSCLVNAAHQFHYERDGETYIIAGYPWFKCRARDMFISLPGLTLAIDEVDYFEQAMRTAEKALQDFMADRKSSINMYEIDKPDVLLWAIWCIQQYARLVSADAAREKYGKLVAQIVDFIKKGGHSNLVLHDNGLLYTDGREHAVTWMNSEVNGYPVVPRSGYVVEINALWYNALLFNAEMLMASKRTSEADEYTGLAELTGKSFKDVFLNEHGYLLDYVDDGYISWSVRPNMLIASSLEYSPLTIPERKKIFDICTKELLTPKGMRSLSPKSGGYNPIYYGGQTQRDAAYHQGTVWPWLSGFYLETCLKIYKRSGLSWVDRCFIGLEEEMFYHCIGTLPELFDGNPPFSGRGAISFAMNVAAVLRVNKVLSKFYNY